MSILLRAAALNLSLPVVQSSLANVIVDIKVEKGRFRY
jgi:hypothetical protein